MIGNDSGVISQLNQSMTGPMTGTARCDPSSGPLLAAAVAINASVISAAVVPCAPSNISTRAPARNAVICASGPRWSRNHALHGCLSADQMAGCSS